MTIERLRKALTGISGILATPFDGNDAVDPDRLGIIVDRAIDAGVHILVSNGNTGEFYALTTCEAQQMVTKTAEMIAQRVPLLAGIGRSIKDACVLAETSWRAGASGLMIHQPPDPFVAPRGMVDYVRQIHQAGEGLPIVLYLRDDAIGLETIQAVCSLDGVVGVKWATPNPLKLAQAIQNTDPEIVWIGGLAETWAPPFYAVGARGFTSGLINVWPEHSVAIHQALERGDYVSANMLIQRMHAFEAVRAEERNGTNVTGVKAALALIGHDCGRTRPPAAWPLTPDQQSRLERFMHDEGLMGALHTGGDKET